jgi:hypothetical protein
VDTVHRRGYRGSHTTGPLVFVLLRPTLLEDEDALGVQHVLGGVRRPHGDEAVRPLPGVVCSCCTHCDSTCIGKLSSVSRLNSMYED